MVFTSINLGFSVFGAWLMQRSKSEDIRVPLSRLKVVKIILLRLYCSLCEKSSNQRCRSTLITKRLIYLMHLFIRVVCTCELNLMSPWQHVNCQDRVQSGVWVNKWRLAALNLSDSVHWIIVSPSCRLVSLFLIVVQKSCLQCRPVI